MKRLNAILIAFAIALVLPAPATASTYHPISAGLYRADGGIYTDDAVVVIYTWVTVRGAQRSVPIYRATVTGGYVVFSPSQRPQTISIVACDAATLRLCGSTTVNYGPERAPLLWLYLTTNGKG